MQRSDPDSRIAGPPVVKICGITTAGDARACVGAGADWLGLNFWPQSKRFITGDRALEIAEAARDAASLRGREVVLVGVFVNQARDHIAQVAAAVGLDRVQLHGDETAADCAACPVAVIKALAMAGPGDVERIAAYPARELLLDTPTVGYGGSGRTFDWDLARAAQARARALGKRIVLAGGLDSDNVATAVAEVRPYGVDVASGVESAPGIKDPDKVRGFISRARAREPNRWP